MSSSPVTSVFNDGYIAEQYEKFQRDPASVDDSWRQYFRFAQRLAGTGGAPATGSADAGLLRKVAGAAGLMSAIQRYGHLMVQIDPLGSTPPGAAELTPEFHGITEADLRDVPAEALGAQSGTALDVIQRVREVYCGRIGYEFDHLQDENEREWFRTTVE